ncbi:MAG TPA: CBS domain-containing protein [Candidatus Limnocylindria bacterium]
MTTAANDLRVGDLMSNDPVVIGADAQATEAERLLKTYRVSGLPVVSGNATVGVISQTDLAMARSSAMISGNWARLQVRHLMTTPAVTVRTGTSLKRAAQLMVTRHIHRLVVVDDEEVPIGVISSLDLLRTLLEDPDLRPGA